VTSVRAPGAPFRIDNNLCSGRTLAPGATCQVTVAFTPQTVGSFSATLQIDAGADASTSTLEGTGVPAAPTTTVVGPTTSTTRSGQSTTSTGPATTGPSIPPTTVPGVTTTGASGTTTSSLPDDQRLLECERQARDAKVFYAPTQKMGKDETQQVQASASIGPATDTTSSPTTGAVSTTVVPVPLRCEVQAELGARSSGSTPTGSRAARSSTGRW